MRWRRYEIDLHDAVYALGKVLNPEGHEAEVPAEAQTTIRDAVAKTEHAIAMVEQACPAKAA